MSYVWEEADPHITLSPEHSSLSRPKVKLMPGIATLECAIELLRVFLHDIFENAAKWTFHDLWVLFLIFLASHNGGCS